MRTEKFVVSCVLWFVSLFASASDPMPLAFEKTPLNEVIAMFSEASGIQVELPNHSNPLVSLDRVASDYDEAIRMIATAASLTAVQVGDGYRLQEITRNLSVLVIELRHREAQQVLDLLANSNTKFGKDVSVIADPETNRLILRGSQSELASINDLVQVFDIEVKQILIEAKLVSQDVDKRRDLGIR